jgi:cobalt-zinc-cadmium efflux system outer membrane protein
LRQALDAAWARQPEAQSLETWQEAATARREAAGAWTAEPPSLELSAKTDQIARNAGNREYAIGLAVPLWLPGERAQSGALAEAEGQALESRALSARLRTAALVREAWWNWRRLLGERTLAESRLANAQALLADVRLRVRAGDLALSDQYQAEALLASAEAALAEAESNLAPAERQLQALTGAPPPQPTQQTDLDTPEPLPELPAAADADAHPFLRERADRAAVARRAADLARLQTRGNPELVVSFTQERDGFDGLWQRSATFGVRVPLGSRSRARQATAHAEAIEAESQLRQEQARFLSEHEGSRARVTFLRRQLAAAEKSQTLVDRTRTLFAKSFRLGETDLPAYLRIEQEGLEAGRAALRARIDYAAAISAWRQALGLLPE